MTTSEPFIITINRELGSGGRTVGALVAQSLQVPFYDKAVIQGLEQKYHLTVEEIEKRKLKKKSWWDDFALIRPFYDASQMEFQMRQLQEKEGYGAITSESIFIAESQILHAIADAGSSVIAGRNAFWVLKDHPNHLNVLIQAPLEQRVERVMRKQQLDKDEALQLIRKMDDARETYVQRFTGTSRYDARNYSLMISMAGKSEEEARDLILKYIGVL